MLYAMREKFSFLSEKIGNIFKKFGLSPNQLSLIAIPLALCTAWLLASQYFVLAGIFLMLVAFCDVVDGAVARATGKVSPFGGYLDGVVDKYSEAIIVFSLLFVPLPAFYFPAFVWIFLYLFGEMSTTFVKATAVEKGLVKKEIRGGLLEKPERTILLLIGIFLAALSTVYLTWVIVLLAFLTNITAFQRIHISIKAGSEGLVETKGKQRPKAKLGPKARLEPKASHDQKPG